MAKTDTVRVSLDEIRAANERGDYQPTRPDAPELVLDAAFWEQAEQVGKAPKKTSVHLRLDPATAEFFRRSGKGHLTRMAKVLKAYADSQR